MKMFLKMCSTNVAENCAEGECSAETECCAELNVVLELNVTPDLSLKLKCGGNNDAEYRAECFSVKIKH